MSSILQISALEELYPKIKEEGLFGKWIRIQDIEPLYQKLASFITVELLGTSEQERPIYKLSLGTGSKKILMWSQMHGNESTGTRAVFDLLNYFKDFESDTVVKTILEECTIEIIPMLNPDGAEVYTRINGYDVDLNRDAVDRQAKESKLLRGVLDTFNPKFCFNLHDQRTIFGVEGTDNPATISFLAPSEEVTRKVTEGRKETMNVIVAMNNLLQQTIPNHVGLYTDEFYPTATGDNFQKLGHNCILIEAGHYPEDYDREETRKYNFYALVQGLYHIAVTADYSEHEAYFNIPQNNKKFYDVIYRYADKNDEAYLYIDEIKDKKFTSTLVKQEVEDLSENLGHKEFVFK